MANTQGGTIGCRIVNTTRRNCRSKLRCKFNLRITRRSVAGIDSHREGTQRAAGVAVAPVVDWTLYDTFYTERYLDTPQHNAEGYELSGVLHWLDGMKSPLLLVHGMADDNVLFANSTKLMADLQNRDTQFRLMTYPGGKHGLSTPAMRKHVYTLISNYFDEMLKPQR